LREQLVRGGQAGDARAHDDRSLAGELLRLELDRTRRDVGLQARGPGERGPGSSARMLAEKFGATDRVGHPITLPNSMRDFDARFRAYLAAAFFAQAAIKSPMFGSISTPPSRIPEAAHAASGMLPR